MKFEYNYLEGETPVERLRNKIQPLFSLADAITLGFKPSASLILAANESKVDIRKLLDDITPFYTSTPKVDYTQNHTFEAL